MLKKQSVIFQTLAFICFVILISACSDKKVTNKTSKIQQCSSADDCLILETKNAKIIFASQYIVVEQLIDVQFQSTKPILSAKLVALNMNMGTVSLLLTPSPTNTNTKGSFKTSTSSKLFLGMCSEPAMKWQLNLNFADGTTEQVTVNAYWNESIAENSKTE